MLNEEPYELYIDSFYYILTTITTVGYGDIVASSKWERLYAMFVEFVGLCFFSFLGGSITSMMRSNNRFEDMINERLDKLDLWIRKLEVANKDKHLPNSLYQEIKKNVEIAFINDFNLLIEDYSFF